MLAIVFWMAVLEPSPIPVMAITAPTPMITPRAVRADASCSAAGPPRPCGSGRQQRAERPIAAVSARRRHRPATAAAVAGPASATARCRPPQPRLGQPAIAAGRTDAAPRRTTAPSVAAVADSPWRRCRVPLPSPPCSDQRGGVEQHRRPPVAPGTRVFVAFDQTVGDADRAMRNSATLGSCVTRITVIPSALSSWNIRRISTLVCESRLPVGSSANSRAG